VDNVLAIRLAVPSKSTGNRAFPATDRDFPDKEGTVLSLRKRLLKYSDPAQFDKLGEDFDLRDRNKSADEEDFVDITLNLSHRHNLVRISNNPVAAVEYFKIAFDAIVTTLFGVQPCDGRTDLLPLHHDYRRGIFGPLTNVDANLEANQKGTLHFHANVTGVISPALIGALAHSPVLMDSISAVFDSMISAALPPDRLLEHVVSELHKTPLKVPRPDFSSQIPPANMSDLEGLADQAAASTKTAMHFSNHCDACVKSGRTCCRFAKPSGLTERTGMCLVSLLEEHADHPDPRTQHFNVRCPEERPRHNYAVDPIEPIDSRPLVFEMKRPAIHADSSPHSGPGGCASSVDAAFDILECLDEPQFAGVDQAIKDKLHSLTRAQRDTIKDRLFGVNGLVSEFNHVLMSVANCNMAIYPMGTAASAKAQFMYTCKYVCKNPVEIASLLSILHDAARHVDRNPSTAEDTGTEDRTTRHYVQRILNQLCGKQEYSGNQVVAALIGLPAEFQMHKCSHIFADAAVRYVAETNHPVPLASSSDSEPPSDSEPADSMSDTDASDSEQEGGEAATSVPLRREIPLLDLLPNDMTEDEEFGAVPDADSDSVSDSSEALGSDSDSGSESSQAEAAAREHEPNDAFLDLLESNQTHTGSVQIVSFEENGTPRTCLQFHDYHFRPTECQLHSLFEYAQTMRLVEKGKAKACVAGKNLKNAGRKATGRFDFRAGHPLRTTHETQIMLQHTVPNIVSRTPRHPGPRPPTLTAAWKSAARIFAYHILLIYKPWEGPQGIPPAGALTWKAMHTWLDQLRAAPADDIVSRTRLQFVTIAAHGLRICQAPARLTTKYRYRNATRLDEMNEADRPEACRRQHQDDATAKANHTAEEGQLSIKRLLEKASAAFDDQSAKMQASTVDFLASAFPISAGNAAQTSQLTANSSKQQCLDHVAADIFAAPAVRRVHASMTAKPVEPQEGGASDPPPGKNKAPPPRNRKAPSKIASGLPRPAQPPSFQWSSQQLQIITIFENYCKAVAAWKALPSRCTDDLPAPPHMLIQGGPGSGKSAVTRKLTQLAKQYDLCSISSAMTAVAALGMENATTNHSAYHIAVNRKSKSTARGPRNQDLPKLSQSQTRIFRSKVRRSLEEGTPVITFIDEVSLMPTITLGHVIQRYREIDGLLIGPFILVGDFFQVWSVPNASRRVFPFMPGLCTISLLTALCVFADPASRRQHNILHHDAQ